jgi:hypothetical protein
MDAAAMEAESASPWMMARCGSSQVFRRGR